MIKGTVVTSIKALLLLSIINYRLCIYTTDSKDKYDIAIDITYSQVIYAYLLGTRYRIDSHLWETV